MSYDHIIIVARPLTYALSDKEKILIEALVEIGRSRRILVDYMHNVNLATTNKPLFVALGGDGTMLTAMRSSLLSKDGSVVGINFGSLGFLSSLEVSDFDQVKSFKDAVKDIFESIFEMHGTMWKMDYRTTLVCAYNGQKTYAVNEILVTTPTRRTPLNYEIYVNDVLIANQSGDGVLVSSATGSTAYALSAGGAIMSPTSKELQVVPLAPHTLSSRPLVLGSEDKVMIKAKFNNRTPEIEFSYDGLFGFKSNNYDNESFDLKVSRGVSVPIIRPLQWNFFEVLSKKLNWG